MIDRFGIPGHVERSVVGFMGCQAAINALKLGWHIVRSDRQARVCVMCLELCTLHLQDSTKLEQLLSFLILADGCAAAFVTGEPGGMRLDGFRAGLIPSAADMITWRIGDQGFDMTLSGMVPFALAHALPEWQGAILDGAGVADIDLWAVHPGGRSILDAVAHGLDLPEDALDISRGVLRDHGNMSSVTVMFVLAAMLAQARTGQRGCAMASGPGFRPRPCALRWPDHAAHALHRRGDHGRPGAERGRVSHRAAQPHLAHARDPGLSADTALS